MTGSFKQYQDGTAECDLDIRLYQKDRFQLNLFTKKQYQFNESANQVDVTNASLNARCGDHILSSFAIEKAGLSSSGLKKPEQVSLYSIVGLRQFQPEAQPIYIGASAAYNFENHIVSQVSLLLGYRALNRYGNLELQVNRTSRFDDKASTSDNKVFVTHNDPIVSGVVSKYCPIHKLRLTLDANFKLNTNFLEAQFLAEKALDDTTSIKFAINTDMILLLSFIKKFNPQSKFGFTLGTFPVRKLNKTDEKESKNNKSFISHLTYKFGVFAEFGESN